MGEAPDEPATNSSESHQQPHEPLETDTGSSDASLPVSEFELSLTANNEGRAVSEDNSVVVAGENETDPMVVKFPSRRNASASTTCNSTVASFRHQPRRKYWFWISAATVICAGFVISNHSRSGMMPLPAGSSVVSKQQDDQRDENSSHKTEAESRLTEHDSGMQKSEPIMVKTDPKLPATITPMIPLHAAEALKCRESVVNFVINATDTKDECEGLKKAFDKTCGDDVPVSDGHRGGSHHPHHGAKPLDPQQMHRFGERRDAKIRKRKRANNPFVNRRKQLDPFRGRKTDPMLKDKPWRAKGPPATTQGKHRRLSEKVNHSFPSKRKWQLWLYETQRALHDIYKYWFGAPKDFLFAEDEILQVWGDAKQLVEVDMDGLVFAGLTRQWEEERRLRWWRRRLEDQEEPSNETLTTTDTKPAASSNRTKINLALPTMKKQASAELINDVLLIHQGDKVINQTNTAAQEAAVSSKAMSDTAAVVSAVLNDPTSVEARICCASILSVYHENCSSDDDDQFSDRRLLFIVLVMALCGMIKSLIRHYRILWLPEAAGCIIVGIFVGYVLMFFPHQDISFDGHWFLRIMVPPIIFEAALSIDKRSFNRHVVPILVYAVVGTLMAAFVTAEILYRGSAMMSGWGVTHIPYVESLTFGALISSIDPIAVLSVLSNMGLTDKDSIYVLIFGESLLNDGIAIVLFETLVHFLDEHLIIDQQAVVEASIHFCVVALGSIMVGAVAGYTSTIYFWAFQGCQTPLVEVLMFFCWALLPYYVCDGIGWSGIVSTVATGMVMDIHIVGVRKEDHEIDNDSTSSKGPAKPLPATTIREIISNIFSNPDGHLSSVARAHIGFVTGMVATTLETAIFAYLGLFLFSHRYHWSFWHAVISILACCLSRGIMIPTLTFCVNLFNKAQQTAQSVCGFVRRSSGGTEIDGKMQFVLWFAGLRGAMSFALVESVPLYDTVSGEGTRLKPELKAMTSACIMFTVFVLGGYTYYIMDSLGMAPGSSNSENKLVQAETLVEQDASQSGDDDLLEPLTGSSSAPGSSGAPTSRRRTRPIA